MKTDPEKTQKAVDDDNRTMANLTPPQTASPVGADSLKASQLPFVEPAETAEQEQSELDTLRHKPFMLTEENPTGEPKNAPKSSTNGAEGGSATKERTIPKGRIIAGSVGIGGDNHPEDVKAIADKLTAMGIITADEAAQATTDPNAMGEFVIRYQKKVFNTISDGIISAGGTTETKIIGGITTKPQPKSNPQSKALSAAKAGVNNGKVPQEVTPMRPPASHWGSEVIPSFPAPKQFGGQFITAGGGISPDIWRSQSPDTNLASSVRDNEGSWKECKKVVDKMAYRHLYPELKDSFTDDDARAYGKGLDKEKNFTVSRTGEGNFLPIATEDKSKVKDIDSNDPATKKSSIKLKKSAEVAISYASEYIHQNIPVVAGVDHTLNCDVNSGASSKQGYGYNEGTTDHFVLLIAQGTDKEGRRFFRFLDPGTSQPNKGKGDQLKLIETSPGLFTCSDTYSGKTYTLTMIVPFEKDKDRDGFSDIVKENQVEKAKLVGDSKTNSGDYAFRSPKIAAK